jgi:hypothetical protein
VSPRGREAGGRPGGARAPLSARGARRCARWRQRRASTSPSSAKSRTRRAASGAPRAQQRGSCGVARRPCGGGRVGGVTAGRRARQGQARAEQRRRRVRRERQEVHPVHVRPPGVSRRQVSRRRLTCRSVGLPARLVRCRRGDVLVVNHVIFSFFQACRLRGFCCFLLFFKCSQSARNERLRLSWAGVGPQYPLPRPLSSRAWARHWLSRLRLRSRPGGAGAGGRGGWWVVCGRAGR